MTFDPHPREVLGGGQKNHSYITPLQEKLACFAKSGIDRCYILTFNTMLSQLSPEQFVQNVLLSLKVETAVVGFNFTYGHLGRGNVDLLRELGGDQMKVNVVRPYHQEGIRVSSTRIREQLHAGQVALARELLGRPFAISGMVVHGAGRGTTIGVPTANIEPDEAYIIPANGVYAVRLIINGKSFDGVMNVGVKPTFEQGSERTLEAHIFQFDQDVYGQRIRVEFIDYLRAERKFSSVQQLISQIQSDILSAKTILAE